jgi:ferrochelatase
MLTGKTAVVLLNLGGPLAEEDIRPYLFNFFMDKNIIAAPWPVRRFVAEYVSRTRSKGAARDAYKHLGFRSPLLDNTLKQAAALQGVLAEKGDVKVFTVMRYWTPFAKDVAKDVKKYAPDNIVLLPLYPQFSTTTVKSSFEDWERAAAAANINVPTQRACCYPVNPGFIAAAVENIRAQLEAAPKGTRLLFSAHGLPEKIVKAGDPYQWQCEKTAHQIVTALDMPHLDWEMCYQSRVGPLKWIGPSTEEALQKAGRDGVGVLLFPHAFVSEHVETIVEIDIEYRHKAAEWGVPWFGKAETVGTHPAFIEGLASEVLGVLNKAKARICPLTCKCGFKN